jgi:hypothetical protein
VKNVAELDGWDKMNPAGNLAMYQASAVGQRKLPEMPKLQRIQIELWKFGVEK